jgi:hypothetical protein
MIRRRVESLTNQVGLCADCLAREQRHAEIAALAERVHKNIQERLAERTPEELREEARRLLNEAQALEAAHGEDATDATSLLATASVEPSGRDPAPRAEHRRKELLDLMDLDDATGFRTVGASARMGE